MILDKATQLATLAAPTIAAVTYSDVVDTLALDDYGMGADWVWLLQIATAFTSGGAGTLHIELVGNNTDSTFAAGTTVVLDDLGTFALGALVAGYEARRKIQHVKPTPQPGADQNAGNYRYIAVRFTVAVATFTAGAINSWLMPDQTQDNRQQPSGYTVA